MARSRHRRSVARGSGEPTTTLPSWAQRHLDEAGTQAPAPTVTTRHRRGAGPVRPDSPLRGWGVAALSVAAAVTAVPLAISAVANDRSNDPLPKVDTFTAGAPQALEGGPGGTTTRRGTPGAADVDDPTAGILTGPGLAPGAAPAPAVVPLPQPAAVVRPTTPARPTTITPRAAAPTSTTAPSRTTTSSSGSSSDDDGEGRSTTKPPSTSSGSSGSSSGNGSTGGGSSSGGQKQDKGLLGNTVDAVGGVVGGVGGVAKGLL